MMERLQNKMYDYEVTPPANVWERIAEALDESEMTHEFPSKLYGIEINPPVGAWNKIRTSLDSENTAASKTKKVSLFIRYAAAAVVIGLIVFGSIRFINSRGENKNIGQQENKSPEMSTSLASANKKTTLPNKKVIDSEEKRNDVALEASKQTFARLDLPSKSKIKIASAFSFANSSDDDEPNYNQQHYAAKIHEGLSQPGTTNYLSSRYITLLTPDGNLIRMSKKLIDLACCVSGEEQDAACKNQLQQWREKIACAPVNASPANFMDIFDLVSSLQDNND